LNAEVERQNEDAFRKLIELLTSAREFGYEKKPNGAELYGHVPHVAPQAWLHTIYPGLRPYEMDQLEQQIGCQIPPEYSWWLARSNGLNLYSGALSFYGLVRLRSRTPDNRQPFELFLEGELQRRVLNADAALFFFGGSSYANGFHFSLDTRTGAVYRCARGSATSLQSWSGIAELIVKETQRLATLFDKAGRCMVDSDLAWP
jgi:SMI1/KNR4 family protein SUKH-1